MPSLSGRPSAGFHVKGSAYRGLQEYIASSVAGGIDAVMLRLPEVARAFFAQTFGLSAWYDVLPIEDITRTAATVARLPHELFCHRYAEGMLAADDGGVYRAMLRFATPELLVRALPFTNTRFFDFTRCTVDRVEDRRYRVVISGIPQGIVFTYIHVTSVFVQHAIEGAGAKNFVARNSAPIPLATPGAQRLVEFERLLSWDE